MKNLKNIFIFLAILSLLISCGGGGGGSSSSGGASPSPSYSYTTIDQRIEGQTIAQWNSQGVALAETYNSEVRKYYRNYHDLANSNISFSTGTDLYGDQFITIGVNKYVESDLEGSSTPNIYNLNYEFTFNGNDVSEIWNVPTHAYITEYYSNADLIAYGLMDQKEYAGTDYVDMMLWWMDYDNGMDDYVAFVFGDKTYQGDMPTGSATFNVKSMGFWSTRNGVYNFVGDGSFSVNFSTMMLTGQIVNDYVTDRDYTWSQLVNVRAGYVDFEGDISGSSFSGTASWDGGAEGEGSFSGNFFGPDGREIGGEYAIFADEDGFYNWVIGSFIGCSGNC